MNSSCETEPLSNVVTAKFCKASVCKCVCVIVVLQELSSAMGNKSSKAVSVEEPPKTTLFERESDGITYRIPALLYLRHCHTFLAFAEKRTSYLDHDAKLLVMRRGLLQDDGSVQVLTP